MARSKIYLVFEFLAFLYPVWVTKHIYILYYIVEVECKVKRKVTDCFSLFCFLFLGYIAKEPAFK